MGEGGGIGSVERVRFAYMFRENVDMNQENGVL